jgi:hypothetical protein
MEKAERAIAQWNRLRDFAEEWFFEPDMEVVEVAISVAMAHYFKNDKPIWLMILGPPGSGKTSIPLTCLEALPFSYSQDDLSSSTFLSGLAMGEKNQFSLLHNIGTPSDRSGILLFPDFTTFMSKRAEEKEQVMGQLRRVYDGEFDRTIGNGRLSWEGKVTIVAAATPQVESHWSSQRNLGERFMQVRWPRGNGIEQAKKAIKQVEHEVYIRTQLRELTREFIFPDNTAPLPLAMPLDYESIGAVHLAELVARLRVHVPRERDNRREIADAPPEAESPTRIIKAMGQLARARATAFHRPTVELSDFAVSRRLALDSIPPLRKKVVDVVAEREIGQTDLLKAVGAPRTTTLRCAEDLEAIGCLESYEQGIERRWLISGQFRELLDRASPLLGLT